MPKMTCPHCGSDQVARIVYGFPAERGIEAAERGEVILGGCIPGANTHGCRSCGWEWGQEEGFCPPDRHPIRPPASNQG